MSIIGGVNYRPPPEQLGRTQLGQVSSWCRYDPMVCLLQVGIEALFIMLGVTSLMFITGGGAPSPLNMVKFMLSFTVLSVLARMISDDLGNKLTISVVSGMGGKAASMLAPRYVGW